MLKKVIYPGLMGALVLIVWTFLVNGIFGFHSSMHMNKLAAEREVYEVLKAHVREPGRYAVNPELTPERMFPENEPVFSVLYGGMGHEAAGGQALLGLFGFLLAPILGAWLLSQCSMEVLQSYAKKVLFFVVFGMLIALFADLPKYGIGGHPLGDALLMGTHTIVLWTLIGVVVAWRMKAEKASVH